MAAHGHAIEARQIDVEQNQVRLLDARGLHGLGAGFGGDDAVAGRAQSGRGDPPLFLIVFDHQDAGNPIGLNRIVGPRRGGARQIAGESARHALDRLAGRGEVERVGEQRLFEGGRVFADTGEPEHAAQARQLVCRLPQRHQGSAGATIEVVEQRGHG